MKNDSREQLWLRERNCEIAFAELGPFWFVTAESLPRVLFAGDDDFKAGMNGIAVMAAKSGVLVLCFVIMSDHAHFLLTGSLENCEAFFDGWKKMIWLWDRERNGADPTLFQWRARFDEVKDLKALRDITAYIARNPYVARRDSTPIGYPYGSADMVFNGNRMFLDRGIDFSDLTAAMRKNICRSRDYILPAHYKVCDGWITKESFVAYRELERLFSSAHQYFNLLAKHAEADIEISRLIGEHIGAPDDEVFATAIKTAKDLFGDDCKLRDLSLEQKMTVAKKLRFGCNASNRQLAQILCLPRQVVDSAWPMAE